MEPQVKKENSRVAIYGSCVLNTWGGPPNQEELEAIERVVVEQAEAFGGASLMVALEEGVPFVNAEQRRELESFYERVDPHLQAVAQVVEGGNLWSVTARSVMTAMRLVQRRNYPVRVFSQIEEATNWIAQFVRVPEGDDPAQAATRLLSETLRLTGR